MLIIFRVNATPSIGMGHLMRCLALASYLKMQCYSVLFVCNDLPITIRAILIHQGIGIKICPGDPDNVNETEDAAYFLKIIHQTAPNAVVIDHYLLGVYWEKMVRPYVPCLLVIDDIARNHDCDIVLDQNFYSDAKSRYAGRVPATAEMLLGPAFALLRPEFAVMRARIEDQMQVANRLVICFGGADPGNYSLKAARELANISQKLFPIDILIGPLHSDRQSILKFAADYSHFYIHENSDDIASLLVNARLCVGAGGSMQWERCCLGVPSLIMAIAGNQEEMCEELKAAGLIHYLGKAADLSGGEIREACEYILAHPQASKSLSIRSMELVDGKGGERVAMLLKST